MPKLSEEKYQKIIADYLSGMTQLEVAKKHGIGRDAVGNILRARNIETRTYTGERISNKKWFWDTEFFNRRDPEVAYWAGFLMADGSLIKTTNNSFTLVLLLQDQDKEHLEKFCVAVNFPVSGIYDVKDQGKQYWRVHLNYYGLENQLLSWGIVPRKTYNFVEPDISLELLPHYLRGWADGDGQIYATGEGARFTISGNTEALLWYANALRVLGYSGDAQFQRRNENYSVLYIGGRNQVQEVIDLLITSENDTKLDRKWSVEYVPKYNLIPVICEQCGREFGVKHYRYEHPTFGRFCSRNCWNEAQKKKPINGKFQCVTCKEWKLLEEMSGNKSYCKACIRERKRQYDARKRALKS